MTDFEAFKTWFLDGIAAWNDHDADALADGEGIGATSGGFGFRTSAPRDEPLSRQERRDLLQVFFDSMDRYQIEDVEIDGRIDGDLALAWGFFTEDFQQTGHRPERVRVRFSEVYRQREGAWQELLFHRDAQTFDADGLYLRQHD